MQEVDVISDQQGKENRKIGWCNVWPAGKAVTWMWPSWWQDVQSYPPAAQAFLHVLLSHQYLQPWCLSLDQSPTGPWKETNEVQIKHHWLWSYVVILSGSPTVAESELFLLNLLISLGKKLWLWQSWFADYLAMTGLNSVFMAKAIAVWTLSPNCLRNLSSTHPKNLNASPRS